MSQFLNKFYKYNKSSINSLIIILIIIIILLSLFTSIFIINKLNRKNESFSIVGDNGILPEPEDRTKLYGSLFLDNLPQVIKNMTDPSIKYDTKRIEIIRYNDVLL
jgi:hypothetical protein